jgi:hypothetical protein
MTDLELRHAKRYQLAVPVKFWWPSPTGSVQSSKGITQNISSDGILVATSECPPTGVHVQMTVFLPRHPGSGHTPELHGEGVVLRVEPHGSRGTEASASGFAASVQFYPEATSSALSRLETSG